MASFLHLGSRLLNLPPANLHLNLSGRQFTLQISNQSTRHPHLTFLPLNPDFDLLLILTLQKNFHPRRQERIRYLYPSPHLRRVLRNLFPLPLIYLQEPSLSHFTPFTAILIRPFVRARRGHLLPFDYRFRFCFHLGALFHQDLARVSLQTIRSFLAPPCPPYFCSKANCQASRQLRPFGHPRLRLVFKNY